MIFSAKRRKGTSESAINEKEKPTDERSYPISLVKRGRKVDPNAPTVIDATPASTSK